MANDIVVARVELNVQDVVINGPSLEIGEMSIAGFEELGLKLRTVSGFSQYWIGDWGVALKEQHGEQAVRKLAELLGFAEKTVRNYMSVSRKYEPSLRSEALELYPDLTFEHMKIALGAPSPEFALELAGKEGWKTKELTDHIRKMKTGITPKEPANFSWLRDPRIIRAEEGFLHIKEALLAMRNENNDTEVSQILQGKFYNTLIVLIEDNFDE